MWEFIIKWLITILRPLGFGREEVGDKHIKGWCARRDLPVVVPVGFRLHMRGASFSSLVCTVAIQEAAWVESGPVLQGFACLRRFEGRHGTAISLRYDFSQLDEASLQALFPWLTRLSAELYQGYEAYGMAFLLKWTPRRFADEQLSEAS